MNVLIVNQPLNNRGDESAHKALVRALIKLIPNVKIKVLFVDTWSPEGIRQFKVEDTRVEYVSLHSFRGYCKITQSALMNDRYYLWNFHPTTLEIKRIYEWTNWVICAPGGICMGGFQSWEHLYFLQWAKFCKKPIIYYGRSIGPFPTETYKNVKFKDISFSLMKYFSFMALRDKKSEAIAQEAQIPFVSTVDTAFLDNPSVDIPYEINYMIDNKEYIVFVPNYLLWHYSYKDKANKKMVLEFYSSMIDIILKTYPMHSIVMLPQTFCFGNYENDDVLFFRDLAKQKNDSRIIVTADCYSSDIQQTIIRKSKVVIGSRYHSIIFAINQNVPFLSLSYEHKMSGLLSTLGDLNSMVDITKVFDSEENYNKVLYEFEHKIKNISLNEQLHTRAKEISTACMSKLVAFLKKQ